MMELPTTRQTLALTTGHFKVADPGRYETSCIKIFFELHIPLKVASSFSLLYCVCMTQLLQYFSKLIFAFNNRYCSVCVQKQLYCKILCAVLLLKVVGGESLDYTSTAFH